MFDELEKKIWLMARVFIAKNSEYASNRGWGSEVLRPGKECELVREIIKIIREERMTEDDAKYRRWWDKLKMEFITFEAPEEDDPKISLTTETICSTMVRRMLQIELDKEETK